jgi:hypothetical protein
VRSQDKKEFFFYHAPYVVSDVQVKEIKWAYVEPKAKLWKTNLGTGLSAVRCWARMVASDEII